MSMPHALTLAGPGLLLLCVQCGQQVVGGPGGWACADGVHVTAGAGGAVVRGQAQGTQHVRHLRPDDHRR